MSCPLPMGDRVRLFARTHAAVTGRGIVIGHNGSVVKVERIDTEGIQVRNDKGTSGFVKWDTLRDPGKWPHTFDLRRRDHHRCHPVRHVNRAPERAAGWLRGCSQLQELRRSVPRARDDMARCGGWSRAC